MTGKHEPRHLRKAPRGGQAPANPDAGALFQIKQLLVKRYRIPSQRILIEHTICITDDGCNILGRLHYSKIAFIRGLKHTPDVMVTDVDDKPVLVVEQDGRAHDSTERAKKDKERNEHYAKAGILCIAVNTKNAAAMGLTPLQYLDEELHVLSTLRLLGLSRSPQAG